MSAPVFPQVPDPIHFGLTRGWDVQDLSALEQDQTMEADVVIIGSGAGGGISAEILAQAGLKVMMVEEGGLRSSRDFKLRESEAYPQLYQEAAARKTADKAITVLQGRTVGGSTTVNWTSSFRTPDATLQHWRSHHGLEGLSREALLPWFGQVEKRLSITEWGVPPNENNALLMRGAVKLGISAGAIRRNVVGCWNLGYCGMGCPSNAKQSMLVTTIPEALGRGATLLTRARATRFEIKLGRVDTLHIEALDAPGQRTTGKRVQVRAKHFILSAGAIGSPALLLRSGAPDPHRLLGSRTFLHPTVLSAAIMRERVDAHAGAPQTVYSDHYLNTQAIDGPIGFKLEAPPIHPLIFATTLNGIGEAHLRAMQSFGHTHVLIALMRDGFNAGSSGGQVRLNSDGSPVLDYVQNDFLWNGVRRALLAMAELQFAAGAKAVLPVHEEAGEAVSLAQAKTMIESLDLRPLATRMVSAHVMGGCAMGANEKRGVIDTDGRHFQIENLHIIDGSMFPSSIGANPQESIYALATRNATRLAQQLKATLASRAG